MKREHAFELSAIECLARAAGLFWAVEHVWQGRTWQDCYMAQCAEHALDMARDNHSDKEGILVTCLGLEQ